MLWLKLFLPFAGAYFLSYLYRTANAVIGPVLTEELALGAGSLGLLTSAYFLAFAAAQLPLGMLLDRFGARRVESGLLLIAAAGAVIFGLGYFRRTGRTGGDRSARSRATHYRLARNILCARWPNLDRRHLAVF